MTNHNPNPITAENLEAGDRVLDREGEQKVIARVRIISHDRCQVFTKDGYVRVASRDEVFELLS